MSDSRLDVTIPMPEEGATLRVNVDDNFIGLRFETNSCICLSLLFARASVDNVRCLAHALLEAADVLMPPSKN